MASMLHSMLHNDFTRTAKFCVRRLVGKEKTFISLKDYEIKCPESIKVVYRGKEDTLYSENQINMTYENNLRNGEQLDTSVVKLKDASCFAYSDLILLANGCYYCETKDNSIVGRASDCSDGYVLRLDKKCYYEVKVPSKTQRLQKGLFLSGLLSWNYYHFTYQIVTKLQWAEKITFDVPLLVDRKAKDVPSFTSLLGICNTQQRPVIVLEENVRYVVEDLYLISSPTVLLPNYKIGVAPPAVACLYQPSALHYLIERVAPFGKYSASYPKRIFLGRKYVTSGRRPFNEEECIACAKEFGFEVVYPELMSFEQQVGLFHNAECIIGGSGAAFTNLVYCNEDVKVVVFSKYHSNLAIWQTIVEFVGGKMCFLEENECEIPSYRLVHASFHVDVQKLKAILNEIV